jgi:hypothetical protein
MSEASDNVQTDKLGIELTQKELDQVKPVDWKLYLFWQDIQEITLQNYSTKGGSTRTGDNFGQGEEIIDRFEDRMSEEYNQDRLEYFEEIREEYGFDQTVTAEMHHYLEESGKRTAHILNRLEKDDSLDALTVRKLLSATKSVSRKRFRDYKEQE